MRKSILVFMIIILISMAVSFIVTNMLNSYDDNNLENTNVITNNKNNYDNLFKNNLTGDSWPITALTKNMPKPSSGNLSIKQLGRSSISFSVSEITLQDYYNYIQSAKDYGFNININENHGYSALNEDNYIIQIYFEKDTMNVYVTY